MIPILSWSDLSLTLNGRMLFTNFSSALNPGDKVFLSGPSGCGKSTFLKIILGLFPQYQGVVSMNGVALTAETVWDFRRKIAWLPQEVDIGGYATAGDFIHSFFLHAANRKIQVDTDVWMNTFLLPANILSKPPGNLSGGEKQRLALAAILAMKRPLLLLDEPLSALDPLSAAAVTRALSGLSDTAILAISHLPLHEGSFRKITFGETV